MALASNELYSSTTRGALPNFAVGSPDGIKVVNFANSAGAETIAPMTPVAYDTSTNNWKVWTDGGANGTGDIRGFLIGTEYGADPVTGITLDATDEVIGTVMIDGTIDYNSIVLPSGETENNLKAALQSGLRERGIIVANLENFR